MDHLHDPACCSHVVLGVLAGQVGRRAFFSGRPRIPEAAGNGLNHGVPDDRLVKQRVRNPERTGDRVKV